jgi:hypothetical protein
LLTSNYLRSKQVLARFVSLLGNTIKDLPSVPHQYKSQRSTRVCGSEYELPGALRRSKFLYKRVSVGPATFHLIPRPFVFNTSTSSDKTNTSRITNNHLNTSKPSTRATNLNTLLLSPEAMEGEGNHSLVAQSEQHHNQESNPNQMITISEVADGLDYNIATQMSTNTVDFPVSVRIGGPSNDIEGECEGITISKEF